MECTLCQSQEIEEIQVIQEKSWHCQNCDLIFKDAVNHLDFSEQKRRYDQHQNNLGDPGYIKYFDQLLSILDPLLQKNGVTNGLDWGSGPEPVLKELLKRRNVRLDIYDPIYQNSLEKLEESYPLLTCTEVIEHFTDPRKSLLQMSGYLRSGGLFAGLTQFHQGPEHFQNWWYARDVTHVVFYSEKTLRWLAQFLEMEILFLESPVFVFERDE